MSKVRTAKRAITTILVPTDFSEYSRQALSYAEMLAKTFDAKIVLIHVIDTVSYVVAESVQWTTEVSARVQATIQPMLDGLVHDAQKRGVVAESQLTQGVPYDQIVKAAEESHADLIVIGTHGRTGMRHVLLGSVAERVVRLAPCPVLTVRSQGGDT
ncbi:MAG: universal stress protein [Nitrospirota bacterium]